MPDIRPTSTHPDERATEGWTTADGGRLTWHTLLSGDRDPTRSMSVGVTDIPPSNGVLQRHRHEPDEVYFVVSGEGVVHIDGTDHPVRPGSAVFVPGNAWHTVTNPGPGPLRVFYVFPVDSFADVEYVYEPGSAAPTWD
jgi:mannose-6-phosphate isomerase-like protein (cupin superfamily)